MRFTSQVGVAALLAAPVFSHPTAHSTSRSGNRGRTIDLSAFRLKVEASYTNSLDTVNDGVELPSGFAPTSYTETATALVKATFPKAEFRMVPDHYVGTNGIAHVVFRQTIHGLDVDNADFNVNISPDGSIFSYGNSFYTGAIPETNPLKKRDQVDPVQALKGASSALSLPVSADAATAQPEDATEHYTIKGSSGALQDPEARLVYFQNPDNTLSLTWRVETDIRDNWLLSYVDALEPKKVFGVVDYVSEATYSVYPWGVNDPSKGNRAIEINPSDKVASEFTWQGDGTSTYFTTKGNNGIAQANWEGDSEYEHDYRPTVNSTDFSFGLDLTNTDPKTYANASVTQLWYTANTYHDLLYVLGFNEAAGNFETNNNGQGGVGGDAVILNAQDGSGMNNANFASPVDGKPGRMRMYLWDYSTPMRDCAFDAGVIIHEYTHGLSNRMTGGPANSGCLSTTEAGGMGEGWSDFMAVAVHMKTTDSRATDYPMGDWVYNKPQGIRKYVYSTSLTTNPFTYKSADGQYSVHLIGTIWATILYEVMWNLIDKHGITSDRKPTFENGVPTDGRFLAMKLVVDGLALQPCRPTFIQARDAIIDADKALTGGSNACALWTGFAKRGLGDGAKKGTSTRTESFKVPDGVC